MRMQEVTNSYLDNDMTNLGNVAEDITRGIDEARDNRPAEEIAAMFRKHFANNQTNFVALALNHFNVRLDHQPEIRKVIDDNSAAMIKRWDDFVAKPRPGVTSKFDGPLYEISTLILKGYRGEWMIKYLNDHKKDAVISLLTNLREDTDLPDRVMPKLKKLKLGWPELNVIEKSMKASKKQITREWDDI